MTLPRVLSLDDENRLRMEPAAEIESLRFGHRTIEDMLVEANTERRLTDFAGKAMEIRAQIELGTAREAGFYVLQSPDGAEQTRISFMTKTDGSEVQTGHVVIDVSQSSVSGDVYGRPAEVAPLTIRNGECIDVRIFIDRSVIEVFANGSQFLTVRSYPQLESSKEVSVFARGGAARFENVEAWHMHSIWPELKRFEDD